MNPPVSRTNCDTRTTRSPVLHRGHRAHPPTRKQRKSRAKARTLSPHSLIPSSGDPLPQPWPAATWRRAAALLPPKASSLADEPPSGGLPPEDRLSVGYLIFFTLGTGFMLPWNAFITAVDYFSFLYPSAAVDRVFSISCSASSFLSLLVIVLFVRESSAPVRINRGLTLFTLALLLVPAMDAVYVKGTPGLYRAFDVTVAATALCGGAEALVQGGITGFAGELPERYMQAVVAGTAASGLLVSAMRVFTKALYPQDSQGLRQSAIIYFVAAIVFMVISIVCYDAANRLPVVVYYKNIKKRAQKAEVGGGMSGPAWRSTLWSIVGTVNWHGTGLALICVVTLSIFPGYITEDVHSEALQDWYPILLISAYSVSDLVGKALTSVYLLQNGSVAVAGCFARLLFYPLFYGCLHGPSFFRTEIPVTVLQCLLGLTNGYLTSILMTVGTVIPLFLVVGIVTGSFVSWFWVI